jgi:hypothetical protein
VSSFGALPEESRRRAFTEVGARLGIPPLSIEKDYWVCFVLNGLFSIPELEERLTFKGGTSLSKVYHLVQRFSEDVDLVVERGSLGFSGERDPEVASTKSARKRLTDQLKAACADYISRVIAPALRVRLLYSPLPRPFELVLDETDPDRQTLLFNYRSILEAGSESYVSPRVKLELGARSGDEPVIQGAVKSFVEEAFPDHPAAPSAKIRTLDPRRTFLEKAVLLHEEHHRPRGKSSKTRLARHLYDVHCLIKAGIAGKAVSDADLFLRVLRNREAMFGYSWMDYGSLRLESLGLVPPEETLPSWRSDYEVLAGEMIYGDPPTFREILDNVNQFQNNLRSRKES